MPGSFFLWPPDSGDLTAHFKQAFSAIGRSIRKRLEKSVDNPLTSGGIMVESPNSCGMRGLAGDEWGMGGGRRLGRGSSRLRT